MNNYLIILTTTFPLGSMDSFIHGELPYLAQRFKRIFICPVNAVGHLADKHHELPQNCFPIVTNTRSKVQGRARDAYCALMTFFSRAADFNEEMKEVRGGRSNRLYLRYFEGRAIQATGDIWPNLVAKLSDCEDLSIYSYWLYTSCRVAINLRRRIQQKWSQLPVRCFSRAHGYDLYEEAEGRGYLPYRRLFLSTLDGVFPCSAHGVNHLKVIQRRYGGLTAPVFVSRLGIEDPIQMAAQVTPDEKRVLDQIVLTREIEAMEGDRNCFEIVTCAWIRPVKRLHLVVACLAELRQLTDKKIYWTHFGSGETAADENELLEAAEALDGVTVSFKGVCTKAFILYYYLNVRPDICVNSSASEGVPVSIMEAMGCKLPIFATDVGGTSELTGVDLCGRLWPADVAPTQMAADIAAFIKLSTAEKLALGDAAFQRYRTLCRADVNYTEFADIISGKQEPHSVPIQTGDGSVGRKFPQKSGTTPVL